MWRHWACRVVQRCSLGFRVVVRCCCPLRIRRSAAVSLHAVPLPVRASPLQPLSAQQLTDCSTNGGNQGCNGGSPVPAYEWVLSHGVCSAAAYPYTGITDTCKKSCKPVAHITGYVNVTINSDVALATAVAQQPVQVYIESDQPAFLFYDSGVITGACGADLDHNVLVVGYDTDSVSGLEYYNVKNSWGPTWGLNGYVWIARGEKYNAGQGECGIYGDPTYPTL